MRTQQLYSAALFNLKLAQSKGHLDQVELQLGKKQKIVNLKIPIMFIIGDNQGGDVICGRNVHYGKSARRISRICDAGPEQLSNPEIGSCTRLKMGDIMALVNEEKYEQLYNLYQAQHWIAWFDLDYGGNPEGIFSAACPPEALHALENGIYFHVLKELFQEILKHRVRGLIDAHVYKWNSLPAQHLMQAQQIEGYPRLLYTNGISGMTDLKADDKVGIIFCVIVSFLQLEVKEILINIAKMEDEKYVDILYIFEMMICYRAWLKQDKFWKRDDKYSFLTAQEAIEKLLHSIVKLMPRSTGNNWDISRIHEQLHVAENIKFFGAHQNVHTGPQEHNHIANTKKPSKLVQRKKLALDMQLAKRLSEKYLIDQAYHKLTNSSINATYEHQPNCGKTCELNSTSSRYSFCIERTDTNVQVEFQWLSRSDKGTPLNQTIVNALVNHFGEDIYNVKIKGYTELKSGKELYQADVNYRSQGHWNDNVNVTWEYNKKAKTATNTQNDNSNTSALATKLVPAELKMIFQIENDDTCYCVVHSCYFRSEESLVLSTMWMKEYLDINENLFTEYKNMDSTSIIQGEKPIFRVIEAESIHSHCLLLPYHPSSCFY
ncbi:MAG TPA: hypothetical protein VIQ31_24145, partial [Phormidium sp.]